MHMITLWLVPRSPSPVVPDRPTEVLLTYCTPADRIEHIWSHLEKDRIALILFVIAVNEAEALLRAQAVCQRALAHDIRLASWQMSYRRLPPRRD